MTGNVKRFMEKLNVNNIKIHKNLVIEEQFILITYTTGFGSVPKSVVNFLEHNHKYMIGVIASGNKNWGDMFAISADIISQQYNVPIIHKFELSGTEDDIEIIRERLREFAPHRIE